MAEFTEAEKLIWEELRTIRIATESQVQLLDALARRVEHLQARTAVLMLLTPHHELQANKHLKLDEYRREFALENLREGQAIAERVLASYAVPPPWLGDSTPKPMPRTGE